MGRIFSPFGVLRGKDMCAQDYPIFNDTCDRLSDASGQMPEEQQTIAWTVFFKAAMQYVADERVARDKKALAQSERLATEAASGLKEVLRDFEEVDSRILELFAPEFRKIVEIATVRVEAEIPNA